jgi:hypothetical protein
MKQVIFGFGCKRRRGKDEAARMVQQRMTAHGVQCRLDSFAHSIKDGIGRGVFGFTQEQLYGDLKTEVDPFWGITPRDVFQRFGTEVMHTQFGKDIWVKTLLRRASAEPEVAVIVSDMRFMHEAIALRELGGTLIRIDRDVEHMPGEDDHPSETSLDNFEGWNAIIDNNGTLEELSEAIYELVDDVLREAGLAHVAVL